MKRAPRASFHWPYIFLVILIGLLFLGGGGIGFATGLQANAQRQANIAALQTVAATITGCQPQQSQGKNRETGSLISYSFTYNDHSYSNQAPDGMACDSASAQSGQPLNVRFLPSDPTVSGLDAYYFLPEGSETLALSGGAALLGLILLYGAVRAALRKLRG